MSADPISPPPNRRLVVPTPRVALVIGAAVVIGVVLYLGREALTPFIVGVLLIYVLDPAVGFVSRLRIGRWTIPRGLAVLIVYLVAFFVIVEALALLLGPLVSQLLGYLRDLPRLLDALNDLLAEIGTYYASLDLPEPVRSFIDGAIADIGRGAGQFDFGTLLPIASTFAGAAASLFGYLIIPIWAFYLLRDRLRLTEQFNAALPPAWRRDTWAVVNIIEKVFGNWIRAQIVLGLIIGAATYGGLLLLGWFVDERFLQFAVLLAVIAGFLELLPIIGPIVSMIPTLLIALTTSEPLVAALAVVALYFAIQQIEGAVLVPKIQGNALELHPSMVIFALIIGGAIAGIVGAILSIPITAAARGIFRHLFNRVSDEEVETRSDQTPEPAAMTESQPATDSDVASKDDGPADAPPDDQSADPRRTANREA